MDESIEMVYLMIHCKVKHKKATSASMIENQALVISIKETQAYITLANSSAISRPHQHPGIAISH